MTHKPSFRVGYTWILNKAENQYVDEHSSFFNGAVVKFYIIGNEVVDIKLGDNSLSNFDKYELGDFS